NILPKEIDDAADQGTVDPQLGMAAAASVHVDVFPHIRRQIQRLSASLFRGGGGLRRLPSNLQVADPVQPVVGKAPISLTAADQVVIAVPGGHLIGTDHILPDAAVRAGTAAGLFICTVLQIVESCF